MKTIRYHFLPLQMSKSEYESTDWLNFTLPIVERDIAHRVKTAGKAPADLGLTGEDEEPASRSFNGKWLN